MLDAINFLAESYDLVQPNMLLDCLKKDGFFNHVHEGDENEFQGDKISGVTSRPMQSQMIMFCPVICQILRTFMVNILRYHHMKRKIRVKFQTKV
jgi:hypothetical protein